MRNMETTARSRSNRKALAFTLTLTILFFIMFVLGLYCTLTGTIPQVGSLSEGFMNSFIHYCAYRCLTHCIVFLVTFIFFFRVHNIDDFVTQSGSYEMRWLGISYISIWLINVLLKFLIPEILVAPHALAVLGVLCILIFVLVNRLANRVDMYLNTDGGHRRLGDMGPLQFMEFMFSLFKQDDQ